MDVDEPVDNNNPSANISDSLDDECNAKESLCESEKFKVNHTVN